MSDLRVGHEGGAPDPAGDGVGAATVATALQASSAHAVEVSLRPLTVQDLARFTFLQQRVGAGPQPGQRWLAAISASNPSLGGGWAILEPHLDLAIGLIIYHAVDPQARVAIVSYALELDFRGRGLGAKALAQAVARLLDGLGFETLFADVDLANVASRRVLHKVGFEPITPGVTPGVQVAPDRPAQRWRMGKARPSMGASIIDLGAVGPL